MQFVPLGHPSGVRHVWPVLHSPAPQPVPPPVTTFGAGQPMHGPEAENLPPGHLAQLEWSPDGSVPARHASHADRAVFPELLVFGMPLLQMPQSCVKPGENVPARHSMHSIACSSRARPAGHAAQSRISVAPVRCEIVLLGQYAHPPPRCKGRP